ncbi:MAG: aldehyde dehydrogenase [Deltaproteobacteria bacterium]|nr:aldehyde dehydrogenase [Deltaproteobacteria bacterium]
MEKIKNYINGQFVDPISALWMPNINPANGETISLVPNSNAADVDQAVQAAHEAFPAWSEMAVEKRCEYLLLIADQIEEHFEEFAMLETLDNGKPLWLSKKIDIPRVVENFRFFAKYVPTVKAFSVRKGDKALSQITRMPVGVAALITPWNLPLYLLTWKIAPALACGNTVVCKPSEVTPMTAYFLAQILDPLPLPKGVFNIVFGTGLDVGRPLVSHTDVKLVSFTGGTQTGKQIEKDIAGQCKKTSLELGGKNAIVIAADVDIDQTVDELIKASFLNQGQICLCGERVFIHADIFAIFVEKFVHKTKKIIVGDPLHKTSFMGPLVSQDHWQKVRQCIAQRVKAGAKVLAGDETLQNDKGYYLRPTILSGLDQNHSCHTEEIFGPVVTVEPYQDEDEVVKMINNSPYGLCASIFCKDQDRAQMIARKIRAGTVWINCWLVRDLRVPFGGMKQSGIGREGGQYSVDFYTEYKTICTAL